MIVFSLPAALMLLGAMYWPVTLGVALVLIGLGGLSARRWARGLCFGVAVLLIADCLLALPVGPG